MNGIAVNANTIDISNATILLYGCSVTNITGLVYTSHENIIITESNVTLIDVSNAKYVYGIAQSIPTGCKLNL